MTITSCWVPAWPLPAGAPPPPGSTVTVCVLTMLRRRLQVAAGLSPLAKALDRGEYVGLLGRERVAELL